MSTSSHALVNPASYPRLLDRVRSWVNLHTRLLDATHSSLAFNSGDTASAIQRIYVINLDRQSERWRQVSRELDRLNVRSGGRLSSISRRFPAVDSTLVESVPSGDVLEPYYSLGAIRCSSSRFRSSPGTTARGRGRIRMTRQEVAVALSHIGVWRLIAGSEVPYTLVVEDDIYFRRGFIRNIDNAWATIQDRDANCGPVDLLYLSFKEAEGRPQSRPSSGALFRPQPGIWQLSGYVLVASAERRNF